MDKSLDIYLDWIKEMIEKIEKYTKNIKTFEEFSKNEEKMDACLTPLVQIWEVAAKIDKYFPNEVKLPYKDIIGFRNILVHTYHHIDKKMIRHIISNHIPKLKKMIHSK